MTGATPNYGLTYPTGTDRLDAAVTTIPQQLATDVENTLLGFGGVAAPGAWITMPTLAAGWANLGAPYQVAQYRKVGQAVYLRGTLTRSGSAYVALATICTLPVGFRPLATNIMAVDVSGTHGQLAVKADGSVYCGVAVAIGAAFSFNSPPIWLD